LFFSSNLLAARITPIRERGIVPGAGIFPWESPAGFSIPGRWGLAAEAVTDLAVADCLAFIENRVTVRGTDFTRKAGA